MYEGFDFYSPTNLKSYNLNESMRYQLNVLSTLDVFTRRHSENVANITSKLCKQLHLSKSFTIYCTLCAYLHDIGKTFIPAEILQKNTRLTDEEFEIMKTHTTIGYKMCMKDSKLAPYAAGALYHHESLDGSGYPNSLTKKDIPYEAQIIRVADEYDAMVSKRQYKSHIDISDTLEILVKKTKPSPTETKSKLNDCGKMDPKIVRALLKIVKVDIEYEISCVYEYIDYLKKQIKRLENIKKWHEEMTQFSNQKDRDYYLSIIRQTFDTNENLDNYRTILDEYKNAYQIRKSKIDSLYTEIDRVKKIEC